VIADGSGRAVSFILAPGQAHELPMAMPLIDTLPGVPRWVVADKGYASHSFREAIWELGSKPASPQRRMREQSNAQADLQQSEQVERLWARLKEWRTVATRYEKTATSFLGVLCLAAACD